MCNGVIKITLDRSKNTEIENEKAHKSIQKKEMLGESLEIYMQKSLSVSLKSDKITLFQMISQNLFYSFICTNWIIW